MTQPIQPGDADATGKAAVIMESDIETITPMISSALRRAYMVVMDDFNQAITAGGIRALHYAVLTVIGREPGVRSSHLSTELRVKHTNLVPLLDQLEARGLIERRDVPQDRRARGLYMTAAGMTLMTFLLPRVAEHERRFAARSGAGGKFMLTALLNRVADPAFDPPKPV